MSRSDRIGIVGAGAAGLGAAHYLKKLGYENIVVLEKESRVGGKCYTLEYDDRPFDMGGLEVGKGYTRVRQLVREFGLSLVRSPGFILGFPKTGSFQLKPNKWMVQGSSMLKVFWGLIRYFYYTNIKYRSFTRGPAMWNTPRELTVSFDEWLEQKNMTAIRPIFLVVVTGYGYGHLSELPAAYVLKFANAGLYIIMAALGYRAWPKVLKEGYQTLWERVAATLPDVRLNCSVSRIERGSQSGGDIAIYVDGESDPIEVDRLIVTCCLDQNLGKMIPNLSAPEREFFDATEYNQYYSLLLPVSDLPKPDEVLVQPSPEYKVGHPWAAVKSWPDASAAIFNGYFDIKTGVGEKQALADIRHDMKELGIEVGELQGEALWTNYFPHVSGERLAAGHFDRIPEIQGVEKTYYAGSLFNFETVSQTLDFTDWMVNEYFA